MARTTPPVSRQVLIGVGMLLIVAAIAVLGSLASINHTDGWYAEVNKVAWNPPNSVFGPAWSFLYVLIAVSGFLIWRRGYTGDGAENTEKMTLWVFALQLVLNAMWTPVFFAGYPQVGKAAWWVALVVIIALMGTVVWLIARTRRELMPVTAMMVPYLLWLTFATSLNAGVIALN